MADYKVPDLAGVSKKFNASQEKLDIMVSAAIDELEVDASTHKSTMLTDNTSLVASNKAMMTELSEFPTTASPPAAEVLQAEADSEKKPLLFNLQIPMLLVQQPMHQVLLIIFLEQRLKLKRFLQRILDRIL